MIFNCINCKEAVEIALANVTGRVVFICPSCNEVNKTKILSPESEVILSQTPKPSLLKRLGKFIFGVNDA